MKSSCRRFLTKRNHFYLLFRKSVLGVLLKAKKKTTLGSHNVCVGWGELEEVIGRWL